MKLSKQKIKNILIIVLSVFVLVPLIYLFFDMNPIQEGMTEWSWGDQSTKMDRVDVSGIEYKTDSTGVSNEYLYCIGGNVVCPSGSELTGDVSYTNFAGTEQLGTTYNFKCIDATGAESDVSHAQCEGNLLSTQDGADFYFRAESADSDGNYAQKIIAGAADLSNESIAGFTTAFNYIPLEISGTYVYLYESDASLDFIATPCYLYNLYDADNDTCASTYYTEVSSNATTTTTTTTTSSTDTTSSTCSNDIPCLAHNGAVVGDPLCCGQSGVLQNTKYNCPASAPYCEGYKCGSSWGKCVSTQS